MANPNSVTISTGEYNTLYRSSYCYGCAALALGLCTQKPEEIRQADFDIWDYWERIFEEPEPSSRVGTVLDHSVCAGDLSRAAASTESLAYFDPYDVQYIRDQRGVHEQAASERQEIARGDNNA